MERIEQAVDSELALCECLVSDFLSVPDMRSVTAASDSFETLPSVVAVPPPAELPEAEKTEPPAKKAKACTPPLAVKTPSPAYSPAASPTALAGKTVGGKSSVVKVEQKAPTCSPSLVARLRQVPVPKPSVKAEVREHAPLPKAKAPSPIAPPGTAPVLLTNAPEVIAIDIEVMEPSHGSPDALTKTRPRPSSSAPKPSPKAEAEVGKEDAKQGDGPSSGVGPVASTEHANQAVDAKAALPEHCTHQFGPEAAKYEEQCCARLSKMDERELEKAVKRVKAHPLFMDYMREVCKITEEDFQDPEFQFLFGDEEPVEELASWETYLWHRKQHTTPAEPEAPKEPAQPKPKSILRKVTFQDDTPAPNPKSSPAKAAPPAPKAVPVPSPTDPPQPKQSPQVPAKADGLQIHVAPGVTWLNRNVCSTRPLGYPCDLRHLPRAPEALCGDEKAL